LGNLELLVRAAALWVGYLALTEILRLVQTMTAQTRERRSPWPRVAVIGGTLVVIVSLVTFAFVLTTRGAATAAERSGKQTCNGKKSLCDLRLDQVTFPGVHHAMASANYPGYLFAQQIGTVSQQLDSGVRALNFDTYYGVPSTARIPGQDVPIILTDKVAAAAGRAEVNEDPVAAKRAAQLAARAPKAADAQRGIYMCHSNCETGAVAFAKPLSEIKSFLNSHPDDVLIVSFHDNTTPADTAAAIEAAGLSDRAATLQPGQPLPTLRQIIDSGRTMLVFSERGGPGGPPWYHNMYDWFQETTFSFTNPKDFNCRPNRGPATAPLFLINHWLTLSPPDPAAEGAVNSRAVLEKRVQQCLTQRGLAPNIIAVNFGERGDLISTVRSINEERLKEVRAKRNAQRIPTEPPPEGTTTPASPEAGPAARLPEPTVITTLTGGDPVRFCRVLPSVSLSLSSWAAAVLTADPADTGLSDLAYAPLLARDLQEYIKAAPQELGPRAAPILDRARAAVLTLHALGLNDRDVKRLADAASDVLLSPKSPDGVEAQTVLVKLLEKKVDAQRLRQAAADFRAGQPDPATLLDLGSVSPEIGVAAGYACAAEVSKV
jgi:hypothetical protein